MRRRCVALVAVFAAVAVEVGAQEAIDHDVNWQIRREATEHSQILQTLHVLTDRYGPRLTGSPNLEAAGRWVLERVAAWGLENGRLEPWDFGHPGWANERLSAHIVSPIRDHLVTEALAWTPGTDGPVRARAYLLPVPARPTAADLAEVLEEHRDAVEGRIVLAGRHTNVPVTFNTPPRRRDEADLRQMFDPDNPARPAPGPPPPARAAADRLTAAQVDEQVNEFLLTGGALLRVNDAGRLHGQIRAFANRSYDPAAAPPTVVMRNEDYGRIARLIEWGSEPVELEFDIVNRVYPEGRTAYNVIAEIPGTDRADEVVMLGAHLDSWHAATGATDNAIGCAVMMEAVRILQAIGVTPRRTIRLALWSGEEQGLLGSRAYVSEHFGFVEDPQSAHARFGGYLNIDSGTGRARGMTVFGPPATAAVLRDVLAPFEDLGVIGAAHTDSRRRGGTDHTSFNEAGLPGIGVLQDPIEYGSHSWHTNLDTFERIIEEDAIKSATVIAATVHHLAMRDELLPRIPADEMPPLPEAAQPRPTAP